jgi:hypothetical protein
VAVAGLRNLTKLEQLNLSGWSLLLRLPDWVGSLSLTKLLLNNCYGLHADGLPLALRSDFVEITSADSDQPNYPLRTSLRELHLTSCTHIVGEPSITLHGVNGLEALESSLGALSRFNPSLRVRVLSEIETR